MPSAPFGRLSRPARRVLDWTALVAVLFGVVASLGQGVFQIGAGFDVLTMGNVADGPTVQSLALIVLLIAYGASAATGLTRGIAVLSVINVCVAVGLAGFVFVTGPTADILRTLWQSVSAYAAELPRLSVDLRPEGPARQWTRDWSLTYFLWWVAWTPFVGVFIARISHGRTVRSFIAGVVLVPSAATLVWFSVFGGAALSAQAAGTDLGIDDFRTAPLGAYVLLAELPFAAVTQALTLILVSLFLITSADSGAYVLGLFSRNAEPGVTERLYWGVVIAALTGAAIWSVGGQDVTRAFAVSGAIPLCALLAAQGLTLMRLFWARADDP